MSLYLKYRPKTISELDLAGVRKTLGDMVAGNSLSHAYLFTGPRGSGKTSAARILARVINCEKNDKQLHEPCNECDACVSILNGSAVDVVEIDAASNRGIDDIRELKERIRLAPARLRKKVYIIDEVHMLTTEAFNALLKTLEEPPDHAVFILCTTESHKVPETIASRCTRVSFTKATVDEMKRSFARVVAGEQSTIDEAALEAIAAAVDGSFRDGVKILDTAVTLGRQVGLADVEIILYGASGYTSKALSTALIAKDLKAALAELHQATADGVDLIHLLIAVMKDLRNVIVNETDKSLIPLVYTLDDTARKVALSSVPEMLLEMAVVDWCADTGRATQKSPSKPDGSPESKKSETHKTEVKPETAKPVEIKVKEEEATIEDIEVHSEEGISPSMDAGEAWSRLTQNLTGDSYSLGALLSKARPGMITGDVLTIEMAHEFHREQLMQEKFRSRVEQLVSDVMGRKMRVACVVAKPTPMADRPAESSPELQSSPHIASITDVDPEGNELMEAAEEIFK